MKKAVFALEKQEWQKNKKINQELHFLLKMSFLTRKKAPAAIGQPEENGFGPKMSFLTKNVIRIIP